MANLIDINPKKEFCFTVTDAEQANCDLYIKNLVGENVAFKIKTTVPKFYVVKPNTGVIGGNSEQTISIALSPIPASVKDHKFMLQVAKTTLPVDGHDPHKLQDFWKSYKELDKDQKQDFKLKVTLQSGDISTKPESTSKVTETAAPAPMNQEPHSESKGKSMEEEKKEVSEAHPQYQPSVERDPSDFKEKIEAVKKKWEKMKAEGTI